MLLYGGVSVATNELLDDLWVLDLTNRGVFEESLAAIDFDESSEGEAALCPWIRFDAPLASTIGPLGGTARGGLVFDPAERGFWLLGGRVEHGDGWATSDQVAFLDMDDLSVGEASFSVQGALVDPTATVRIDTTNANCHGEGVYACFDDETCETLWEISVERCAGEATAPDDCDSTDEGDLLNGFQGCELDPYCVYGADQNIVSLSAPGVAGAGFSIDPTTGAIVRLRGFSGCDASDCSDWDALWIHAQVDAGGTLWDMLPNDDALVISGTHTHLDSAMVSLYSGASGWPGGASRGVWGLGSAMLGLEWSHTGRWFLSSGTTRLAYAGGTIHRGLAPQQEHSIYSSGSSTACGVTEYWYDNPGDWSLTTFTEDADDGLLSADVSIGTVTVGSGGTTWTPLALSTVPFARRDAAVAAIDADRFLVVGGSGGGGEADILLVDADSGLVQAVENTVEREGATVVWDPLEARGVIFGGRNSTNTTLVGISDVPTVLNGEGGTWAMETTAVRVERSSSDPDAWLLEQDMVVRYSCQDTDGGARCGTSNGYLHLPTTDPAELDTLDVELEYDDGLLAVPGVVAFETSAENAGSWWVGLRLPRVVVDGEAIEVRVRYTAWARERPALREVADVLDRGLVRFPIGEDGEHGYILWSLPAWWGTGQGELLSSLQLVQADWQVDAGISVAVLGPGEPDDPTAAVIELVNGPAMPPAMHNLVLLEGVAYAGTTTAGDGTRLYRYTDGYLGAGPASVIEAYAGSGGWLDDDHQALADRLGSHPLGYSSLAWLRAATSTDVGGWSFAGTGLVTVVSPDGLSFRDGDDGDDTQVLGEITVHEMCHAWWGVAVRPTVTKAWMVEGLCSFMEGSQYASTWTGRRETQVAVDRVVDAMASRSDLNLDSTDIEEELHYTTGAWIILQAWLHRRGVGDSDADFWATFQATVATYAYTQEMSDSEAETLLDDLSGLSGFTAPFVDTGALSIPMVAMTRLDLPEEGDTGSPDVPGTWQIEQVQGAMFDAPSWSQAPYVFACSDADDDSVLGLEICDIALAPGGVVEYPLNLMDLEVVGGSIDTVELPLEAVRYRLYDGPSLATQEGRVTIIRDLPSEDLLRCSSASVRTDCLEDADLDGHPDDGDCVPLLSDVHPLWVSPDEDPCPASGASYDYNCDGWTCP